MIKLKDAFDEAQKIHKEMVERMAKPVDGDPVVDQFDWEALLHKPEALNSNLDKDNNILWLMASLSLTQQQATALNEIICLSLEYGINMGHLVAPLRGIIALVRAHHSGRVVIHTGLTKTRKRFFSTELRRIIEEQVDKLDETQEV